jgi:Zn ribbon nucleic-acid-binding protein
MNNLSALELLNIWEQGRSQTLHRKALLLLAACCPEKSIDALSKLSIGHRDALLLTLREKTFGQLLIGIATCPACAEQLDITMKVSDILIEKNIEPNRELTTTIDNYEVKFRLPDSTDIAFLDEHIDMAAARQEIYEHCILSICDTSDSKEISINDLPVEVMNEISDRIAKADTQADILIGLSCPSCNKKWQMGFDIVSFFWSEINTWAYRILYEVRILAMAYGWSERDILAMSSWRRQIYLEMSNG